MGGMRLVDLIETIELLDKLEHSITTIKVLKEALIDLPNSTRVSAALESEVKHFNQLKADFAELDDLEQEPT